MKAVPAGRELAAVMIATLLLVGCSARAASTPLEPVGRPTQPVGTATSRPAPAPSATPAPTVNRADLLTVYRSWWQAVQGAFARGDAGSPALALYGVDPILTKERDEIRKLRAEGVVQRTKLTLKPQILHQEDIAAEIADCIRGPAGTYYDVATGKPRAPHGYSNDVPTRDALHVALHKRGGYWFVVAATNEGVQPC
jgi:hypothetical protein